jgi:hypothetical protein
MLSIALSVITIGHQLAMSVCCSACQETPVTATLLRAIGSISRIAVVARSALVSLKAADVLPVCDSTYEEELLLANDMRVLSVALSRAAVDLSRQAAAAVSCRFQKDVAGICLLSRTASVKARKSIGVVEKSYAIM